MSIQHAIQMLVREVAMVEEAHEGTGSAPTPGRWCCAWIRYVKTTSPSTPVTDLVQAQGRVAGVIIITAPIAAVPPRRLITCYRSHVRGKHVAEHGSRLPAMQQSEGQSHTGGGRR